MSEKTIDLMSVLVDSLKHGESSCDALVTFPRADDNANAEYFGFYRRDCQSLMRHWLARTFAAAPTLPQSIETGVSCAVWFVESEIGRPLNAHELRLLGEAVRDWITSRVAMARLDAERSRQVP